MGGWEEGDLCFFVLTLELNVRAKFHEIPHFRGCSLGRLFFLLGVERLGTFSAIMDFALQRSVSSCFVFF